MEPWHAHAGAVHTAGGLCDGLQVCEHRTKHARVPVTITSALPVCSFQEPQEEEDDEEDEEEKTPNPPVMVPMADMLNHVSSHNANLEFMPVRGHFCSYCY